MSEPVVNRSRAKLATLCGRVIEALCSEGLEPHEAIALLHRDFASTRYVMRGLELRSGPGYLASELLRDQRLRAGAGV